MADMLRRQILPAVSKYAAELCERGWKKEQMGVSHKADDTVARDMGQLTDKLFAVTEKLERDRRCQKGHDLQPYYAGAGYGKGPHAGRRAGNADTEGLLALPGVQ